MSKRFLVIFQKVLQFIKIDSVRIILTGFNSDIGPALSDIFVNCLNNLRHSIGWEFNCRGHKEPQRNTGIFY